MESPPPDESGQRVLDDEVTPNASGYKVPSKLMLVMVHGVNTVSPSPLVMSSIWTGLLDYSQLTTLTFSYSISDLLRDKPVQSAFVKQADHLLRDIRGAPEFSDSQIVFFAADLGGAIVKEALVVAASRTDDSREIVSRTTLVAFFGSLHRAEDTSESVLLLDKLFREAADFVCWSTGYPQLLVGLAVYHESLAKRFDCAEKPYYIITVSQQCQVGPSKSDIIFPEPSVRISTQNEILFGRNRAHSHLIPMSSSTYHEQTFWRIQLEDAAIRVSVQYRSVMCLFRKLGLTESNNPRPSRQTYNNVINALLSKDAVKEWHQSSTRYRVFLRLEMPNAYFRFDILGTALVSALHSRIDTTTLLSPITTYLDIPVLEQGFREFRGLTHAYGSLCEQIISQQPSLFIHVLDVIDDVARLAGYRLYKHLMKQLRSLVIRLVSSQNCGREFYIVLRIDAFSELLLDVLNTLAIIQESTDCRVTVIILSTQDQSCHQLPPSSSASSRIAIPMREMVLRTHETSLGLDEDFEDWLKCNARLKMDSSACGGQSTSKMISTLKAAFFRMEADQFLFYMEQLSESLSLIPPTMSMVVSYSQPGVLAAAATLHGIWLVRTLLWIYNATRPLTLDELDEVFTYEMVLKPKLTDTTLPSSAASGETLTQYVTEDESKCTGHMIAKAITQTLPGTISVKNNCVFPVSERIRHELDHPDTLKLLGASSRSEYMAISCLLHVKHELSEGGSRPSKLARYTFRAWPEHYFKSPPLPSAPRELGQSIDDDAGYVLEKLATDFLYSSADVERWLQCIRPPVDEWPGASTQAMDELALDENVLPASLHGHLGLSHRQAAHLAAELVTRLDVWNAPYESLLLTAVEEDDIRLFEALCDFYETSKVPQRPDIIGNCLAIASPNTKDILTKGKSIQETWLSVDNRLVLYAISSHEPIIIPDLVSSKPLHVPYLLGMASQLGEVELVERILESVASSDNSRAEALLVAAGSNQLKVVQKLLKKGFPDGKCTESGLSAIMVASQNGFFKLTAMLLSQKAEKEREEATNERHKYTGYSALHLASRGGFLETVNVLLKRHANTLLRNDKEELPLHLALFNGHTAVAEALLKKMPDKTEQSRLASVQKAPSPQPRQSRSTSGTDSGSDSDSDSEIDDVFNIQYAPQSKLPLATHSGSDAEELISPAAGMVNEQDIPPMDYTASSGESALLLAARLGSLSLCEMITEKNASLDIRDHQKNSVLHNAAMSGSEKLVGFFMSRKMDSSFRNAQGQTALQVAAVGGYDTICQLLLNANKDLALSNAEDGTFPPLKAAIMARSSQVVEVLVNGCHNVGNMRALERALLEATSTGQVALVHSLLDKGVNTNAVNEDKETALHLAASRNHPRIIDLLVIQKADIEAKTNTEITPIIRAAYRGCLEALRALIDAGANLEASDRRGMTVLYYAIWSRKGEPVKLLLDKGSLLTPPPSSMHIDSILAFTYELHFLDAMAIILAHMIAKDGFQHMEVKPFLVSILQPDDYSLGVLGVILNRWNISEVSLSPIGTAIHHAAFDHHDPVIELLLSHPEHPLDVNAITGKFGTPLQAAAAAQRNGEKQASLDTVELLIIRGADVSLTGGMKFSPLHAAVFERNTDIARYLLRKMNPEDILRAGGEHGTVLQALLSRQDDHWSKVDGEDDTGANPDSVTEELFKCLLEHGESVMRGGRPQDPSALHRAAQYASLHVLELVMKQPDVDIWEVDIMGRLPIHMAVRHSQDQWDIITTLDPNLNTLWVTDRQWRTVLHFAAGAGAIDVIRNILNIKKREDENEATKIINQKDHHGWTPLHWACRQSNWDVVELLIEEGASKTAATNAGWLPRHVAIHHDNAYYDRLPDQERSEERNREIRYSSRRSFFRKMLGRLGGPERLPTGPGRCWTSWCSSCQCRNYGDIYTCAHEECPSTTFCFKCYKARYRIHPSDHEFCKNQENQRYS